MSILSDTKKMLGIPAEDTSFDVDVMIHVNSVFSTLHDVGVGPEEGFELEEDANWDAFITDSDPAKNYIKSYVYLKTRLLFDPPQIGFLVTSLENQADEFLWRISTRREAEDWVPPVETPNVIDGGDAD